MDRGLKCVVILYSEVCVLHIGGLGDFMQYDKNITLVLALFPRLIRGPGASTVRIGVIENSFRTLELGLIGRTVESFLFACLD